MDSIGLVLNFTLCLLASVSLCASLLGVLASLPYVLISESECAFSSFYNLALECSLASGCNSVLDYSSVPECNSAFKVCDSAGIEICYWFATWFTTSSSFGIPS